MITKITFAPLLNSFEAFSADNHDTYNTFFHLRCCLYHSSHILTEAGLVLKVFLFISYVLWPSPFSVILSPYSIFFATKSQYFFLFIYIDCRVFVVFFKDKLPERGKSFYGFFLKIEVVLTTILIVDWEVS